jgi:predicted ATP-dependent endonuclease of OLD family
MIGANNSGKSFILKTLALQLGEKAAYLGPSRYNNFVSLAPYSPNRQGNRRADLYKNFSQSFLRTAQNIDNSPFNTQQAIAELGDIGREKLFKMVSDVLRTELSLEQADPDNAMSVRYIAANGHNFSYASSGVRLLVSILTSLSTTSYEYFFVDEPELGISPESQARFADFIYDEENRKKYFPHARAIVLASHSPTFLNRRRVDSNFRVEKFGGEVHVSQVRSLSEFNDINFYLLGNRLESLFLPSCIIFVEGKTDKAYLERVISLKFPRLNVSIIAAGGDSQVKQYAHMLSSLFPDFQQSPFRGRVLAVMDAVHESGVISALTKKGFDHDDIVIWEGNGIEYVYPPEILERIFGTGFPIEISKDEVSAGGTRLKKDDLSRRVMNMIGPSTRLPDELVSKLLNRLARFSDNRP